ncbi:hypothetical protein Hdeb2414_s0009g00306441 [Helianthus debilis subsp. tardiflorus]
MEDAKNECHCVFLQFIVSFFHRHCVIFCDLLCLFSSALCYIARHCVIVCDSLCLFSSALCYISRYCCLFSSCFPLSSDK